MGNNYHKRNANDIISVRCKGKNPQKEKVTDVEAYTTQVVRDLKFPYHAYCTHKETGMVVEQAGQSKSHAVSNAEHEMNHRIKNGEVKA